ncbi:WXG100 family type VII secretion target [Nocardia cyriacigeorgica]|uniref:WXG100 family type VII secretion target n=1 Tax=Nocardia cyriacigeorgica TaxID=135487 RepID=A0A5R8P286_9NOCA|nr:WXG100 family type VII secretion target [Nocardia cyriacigeorgica]TLF82397.1 WXG100 family type VII secretion target [Nocardia cyriacigeorgica]
MSGNVRADAAAMETSAKHVENVNNQLGSELGVIRNLVQGSAEHWEGAAAGSFKRVMDDYDRASDNLHTVLQDIAAQIRKNGVGYTEAEQQHHDDILKAGASGDLGSDSSLNLKV